MERKAIKEVKLGEYVQLKENGPMYKRGDYVRADKKFELQSCDDMNRFVYRKGSVQVVVGATY